MASKKQKKAKEKKKEKPEEKPEEKAEEKEKPKKKKVTKEAVEAENAVFIGRKPVMNYVVACMTYFNAGEKEVVVKARGQAISRAVDTVELLRRAFVKGVEVKSIDIGTEEVTGPEGQSRNVSTMEITLVKA
jgi:DNA-binding protein